ncbi:MAG: triphosphoribosyl-dephospho-CoA synthase [Aigarchaeota archaeon]|nr:triphosphoribosyl-dephospho-CoA synthase [Candidatus Pelearchaeum maunauluense]
MDADNVASCMQLALLLELSATPKPGLVDRESRRRGFECFLASIASLYPHFREAVLNNRAVGTIIERACKTMLSWQHEGNTHLGAILLLTPIAAAAGKVKKIDSLRTALKETLLNMDYRDTISIFRAINLVRPAGLKRVAYLDVRKPETEKRIVQEKIAVVDAFRPYSHFDAIAHEYATNYQATYAFGYSFLKKQLSSGITVNEAAVMTFLNILACFPDTNIARRNGYKASILASKYARKVLRERNSRRRGELLTWLVKVFSKSGWRPASTADILAASFSILLLEGWRP